MAITVVPAPKTPDLGIGSAISTYFKAKDIKQQNETFKSIYNQDWDELNRNIKVLQAKGDEADKSKLLELKLKKKALKDRDPVIYGRSKLSYNKSKQQYRNMQSQINAHKAALNSQAQQLNFMKFMQNSRQDFVSSYLDEYGDVPGARPKVFRAWDLYKAARSTQTPEQANKLMDRFEKLSTQLDKDLKEYRKEQRDIAAGQKGEEALETGISKVQAKASGLPYHESVLANMDPKSQGDAVTAWDSGRGVKLELRWMTPGLLSDLPGGVKRGTEPGWFTERGAREAGFSNEAWEAAMKLSDTTKKGKPSAKGKPSRSRLKQDIYNDKGKQNLIPGLSKIYGAASEEDKKKIDDLIKNGYNQESILNAIK